MVLALKTIELSKFNQKRDGVVRIGISFAKHENFHGLLEVLFTEIIKKAS